MAKVITLRYAGRCADCGATLEPGARARYYGRGRCYGLDCHEDARDATQRKADREASRARKRAYVEAKRGALQKLVDAYGFGDVEQLLACEQPVSMSPGICTACGETADVEPSTRAGECTACGERKVASASELARVAS